MTLCSVIWRGQWWASGLGDTPCLSSGGNGVGPCEMEAELSWRDNTTWDGAPVPLEGKKKGRFLHPCCREQKVIGTLWEQRALSKPMRTLRGNGGKPSVQCAQGWKPSDFSDEGLDLRKQNNNKTAPVLTHGSKIETRLENPPSRQNHLSHLSKTKSSFEYKWI